MLHYDRINSQLRMIWDELRCRSYGTAITRAIKPGDVVIDFGSGLGIWAMAAARSGASRVYAIEANDDVADVAQALIAENGFSDRITLIKADAATVDLPEKADLIISELLNCAGFNEYDGHPLMKVRDRYLKPGGRMIPQRIRHLIRPMRSADPVQVRRRPVGRRHVWLYLEGREEFRLRELNQHRHAGLRVGRSRTYLVGSGSRA